MMVNNDSEYTTTIIQEPKERKNILKYSILTQ